MTRAQTAAAAAAAAGPRVAHTVQVASAYVNWDAVKGVFTFATAGVTPQNVAIGAAVVAVGAYYHEEIEDFSSTMYANALDVLYDWPPPMLADETGSHNNNPFHGPPPPAGLNLTNDDGGDASHHLNHANNVLNPFDDISTAGNQSHNISDATTNDGPTTSPEEPSFDNMQVEIYKNITDSGVDVNSVTHPLTHPYQRDEALVEEVAKHWNVTIYGFSGLVAAFIWGVVGVLGLAFVLARMIKKQSRETEAHNKRIRALELQRERDIIAAWHLGRNNNMGAAAGGTHIGGMVPGLLGAAKQHPPPLAGHGGTGGAGAAGGNNGGGQA